MKDEIRYRMRQVRRAIPEAARAERCARIHASLFATDAWKASKTVMLFASMRAEVDTFTMEARARSEGKTIACPRMTEDLSELDPRVWEPGIVPVEQGRMAPEPPANAPSIDPLSIDLIIVPCVAMDERGARIGYGRGFYDRFLARTPQAHRIAVAFDFQLIAEVPETEGDVRVDMLITDARVLHCTRT